MSNYYYNQGRRKMGPLSLEQIQKANLSENTLVWKEGLASWIEAKELPELATIISTAPPPLPEEIEEAKRKVKAKKINDQVVGILLSGKSYLLYGAAALILSILLYVSEVFAKSSTDQLFPVYTTYWERQHPFLSFLRDTLYLFIAITIIMTAIRLIRVVIIYREKDRDIIPSNAAASSGGTAAHWEKILTIVFFVFLLLFVIYLVTLSIGPKG